MTGPHARPIDGHPAVSLVAILALTAALGLALRLAGITFGLPDLYHVDEPTNVNEALAVSSKLVHGLSFDKGPLFKYLLRAEYGAAYLIGRVLGRYGSPQEFV